MAELKTQKWRSFMRIDILGVSFDSLTKAEAVSLAYDLMERRQGDYVVTPNPEIVMHCREDEEMAAAVREASLVIADGIGVIYGAKILKTPLPEKIPGIDFTLALLEKMAGEGKSVYLFGSKPGVAEAAGENLAKKFEGLKISGCHDGYFTNDANIVRQINEAAPDLLLVCLGAPRQEKWMRERRADISAGLMIGAGGSMDVFAGTATRAPQFWQKAGLEWLYRLLKEPRRIGRMMKLPKFLLCVIFERIKK